MLQRPCILSLSVLNVMRLYGRYTDSLLLAPGKEIQGFEGRDLEHPYVGRAMSLDGGEVTNSSEV